MTAAFFAWFYKHHNLCCILNTDFNIRYMCMTSCRKQLACPDKLFNRFMVNFSINHAVDDIDDAYEAAMMSLLVWCMWCDIEEFEDHLQVSCKKAVEICCALELTSERTMFFTKQHYVSPFWAKPVLRRFSGLRIGSVGASWFVDDFVSFLGQAGVEA